MPIKYDLKPRPYDLVPTKSEADAFPDGAEPEHMKDCDINIMIGRVMRGQQVNGSTSMPIYGYDDLTQTGLSHRIQKQQTEAAIAEAIQQMETEELSEEEISEIKKHPQYQNVKFKVRKKEAKTNDDQTTNTNAPKNVPETTPTPTPTPAEKAP